MRFRGTLVLLVLCLGLALFLYFYEYRGAGEREKTKQEENKLWTIEAGEIRQLELTSSGETIALVRSDEKGWIISSPRSLSADGDEVDRIASAAAGIRRESTVETEATDLSRYGLDPAAQVLRVSTKDGKNHSIRFGGNNPTGSFTYAVREGENEVFLVAGNVAGGFAKKLDDLRNRAVLNFDQYDTHAIEIRSAKDLVRLTKEDDRWWLDGKDRWAADSSQVTSMLGALANGRLAEFFEENPEEYANTGFDAPLLQVRLTVGKDGALKQLVVGTEKAKLVRFAGRGTKAQREKKTAGASTPDSIIFLAKDASRDELFFVNRELVDQLSKPAEELRDRSLAQFKRWEIDEIILTNASGTLKFAKSETGSEWLLGDPGKKTKWDAVSGILDLMEKPVMSFADSTADLSAYGLDKPAARVILKKEGAVKVDCSLGRKTAEGVYLRVYGEPAAKIAAAEVLDGLSRKEIEFLEPVVETGEKAGGPAKK